LAGSAGQKGDQHSVPPFFREGQLLLIRVWNSWSSRLEEHEKFCKSKMGKYILELEEQLDKIKNER